MCDCGKNEEATENALLALDGAISALVMARIILEGGTPRQAPEEPAPAAAAPDGECLHPATFPITTMGGEAAMCSDCGETL